MENTLSKTLKDYKKQGKARAADFLRRRRAARGDQRREIASEQKQKIRDWKKTLSALEKKERKAQKKAYKAYKHRLHRTRTIGIWGAVVLVLALVGSGLAQMFSALAGVLGSQKYTDTGAQADAAREAGYALSTEICEEGFVLLKNDNGLLPLKENARLSIFGDDAYNFVYGGSGSAGADQSGSITLFEALEDKGLSYNKDLDALYRENVSTGGGTGSVGEMVASFLLGQEDSNDWFLPEDSAIEAAARYSDTALIVLSSMEVEGNEIELKLLQIMGDGMPNRAALIDKVCRSFDHVVFLINSGNVMELAFLKDYPSAEAALWVGSPGSLGCPVAADVLTGKVNPSGRTVDTWPVSIEREPSYLSYGDFLYDNCDLHVMEYSEGIYIGYRYYETRFREDPEAYAENVVFPFGHGLSYTTFEEKIADFAANDETITLKVQATNTGKLPGKDVVQVYYSAPYYPESGLEKSAIALAGYGKTGVLEPGQSETITVEFDVRDMASYARNVDGGCYLLEHGDYQISIGKNVHDALLSKDGKTYTLEQDVKYTTDDATGVEIQNHFGYAEGDTTYLSRSDWEGTFPKAPAGYSASAELLAAMDEYNQGKTVNTTPYSEGPAMNVQNGIQLADLKGLPYDDPQWDAFLDQFTAEEMMALCANGGWHTIAIPRLGVQASHLLDGPSGINSMFNPINAVAYPMETIVSSGWNDELARRLGEVIGDEAAAYGVNGWYAPAMNIHRSSIGGRNNEYYSEDPLLSGRMAAATIQGAQSKGLIAFMKHFVCNDVELNARNGIVLWVNEQTLREIYLRPFEMAVKDGGAYGAMSSFSMLGHKWCGGSSELLNDLLRTEWGFRGVICTDACLGSWMHAGLATKNGNDLMLDMGIQASLKKLQDTYKQDPVGEGYGLRCSVHNICYALVNGTSQYGGEA